MHASVLAVLHAAAPTGRIVGLSFLRVGRQQTTLRSSTSGGSAGEYQANHELRQMEAELSAVKRERDLALQEIEEMDQKMQDQEQAWKMKQEKLTHKVKNLQARLRRTEEALTQADSSHGKGMVALDLEATPLLTNQETVSMSTESIADFGASHSESQATAPPPRTWAMSATATESMVITFPGCYGKRDEGGGVEIRARWLLSKVQQFWSGMTSIKALAQDGAKQLALVADEVHCRWAPRARHSTRRKVPTGKPQNVFGAFSRKALTQGIYAGFLAFDRYVFIKGYFRLSLAIHFALDGSSFGPFPVQGALLTATELVQYGMDALGQPLYKTVMRSTSLNSLPCADKKVERTLRDDGSPIVPEGPYILAKQMAMSGVTHTLLNHTGVFVTMDKGTENLGSGKGAIGKRRRNAFMGTGSYFHQIWATREAVVAAMEGEHGAYLREVMDFLGVPAEQQRFSSRPLPEVLDASGEVKSVERTLKVCSRALETVQNVDGTTEWRWKVLQVVSETLPKRISIPAESTHPLAEWQLVQGVCAHATWCDKHGMNIAGTHCCKLFPHFFSNARRGISTLRHYCHFSKLRCAANGILGIPGYRTLDKHKQVADAMGPLRLQLAKQNNPNGLRQNPSSVESRWLSAQLSASRLCVNRLLLMACMVLSLADGTADNKVAAAKAVFSDEGFQDRRTIRFSAKMGKLFGFLDDPATILMLGITRCLYILVWEPLFAATAHAKECSSLATRGVRSFIRVLLRVLRRDMLCCLPGPRHCLERLRIHGLNRRGCSSTEASGEKPKPPEMWDVQYRMAHRGTTSIKCRSGQPLLSTRLERDSAKSLRDLYGVFYKPEMATAISELLLTFDLVSRKANPAQVLNHLPLQMRARYLDVVNWPGKGQGDKGKEVLNSPGARKLAAEWLMVEHMQETANQIEQKFHGALFDPLGFMAGLTGVVKKSFQGNELEYTLDDGTGNEPPSSFIIAASPDAIANGVVLLAQAEELMAWNSRLPEFVSGPYRQLIGDPKAMDELRKFVTRQEAPYSNRGKVSGPCPLPVNVFFLLCPLAYRAACRRTNNGLIESKWSLLTQKFLSGVRRCLAAYWSALFRHSDIRNMGFDEAIARNEEFLQLFQESRVFMRDHAEAYRSIFRSRLDESEDRRAQRLEPKAPSTFKNSGIVAPKETAQKTKQPVSRAGRMKDRTAARHAKRGASSESGSDGDSEWSEPETDDEESEHEDQDDECEGDDDGHGVGGGGCSDGAVDSPRDEPMDLDPPDAGKHSDDMASQHGEGGSGGGGVPGNSDVLQQGLGRTDGSAGSSSGRCDGSGAAESNGVQLPEGGASGRAVADSAMGPKVADSEAGRPDSEATDLSDDSDLDVPLKERGQASRAGQEANESPLPEEWNGLGAHPFTLAEGWTMEAALQESRYKLSHIRALLMTKEWQPTISSQAGARAPKTVKAAEMTRLDQAPFRLAPQGVLFYVLYGDDGLELIYVQSIFREEGMLRVRYTRVLSTEQAMEECKHEQDLEESITLSGAVVHTRRLGSRSLEQVLTRSSGNKRPTFHRGDVSYTTEAGNIVGFVGWSNVSPDGGRITEDVDQGMATTLTPNVQRLQPCVKRMAEIDWVYCGADFSDREPEP